MERLTVILPARNAEKTIRTAVSSVLRGLPRDGRVFVLNDASSDSTGELLAGLAREDGRVGVLTSDVQLGVSGACNVLIDAADTPLIARMDADDIALPWRFRLQIPAMYRSNLDAVFGAAIHFGGSGSRRLAALLPFGPVLSIGPGASPYELLLGNKLGHPTVVGRRSAIVGAGCYRRVPAEDWDLWIRMALQGSRLGRIALPTLLYRHHAEQVSATKAWQKELACAVETAQVHQELSEKLLGFSEAGAYPGLTGPSAEPKEVRAAMNLTKAVRMAANSFPLRDRLAVRMTALTVMHRIRGIYGTNL